MHLYSIGTSTGGAKLKQLSVLLIKNTIEVNYPNILSIRPTLQIYGY